MERFTTHNDGPIDVNFCMLVGTIQASLTELRKVFGPERQQQPVPQVKFDWHIRFEDGSVATIYNWHDEPRNEHEPHVWRIGARQMLHAVHVHDVFRRGLREARAA